MKSILLTLLIITASQLQAVVTVGFGDCNHDNIADALDDVINGDANEIRVVNNLNYMENLALVSLDVDIIGGYTSCENAEANIKNPEAVFNLFSPDDNLSVIRIIGDQPSTINLENMNVQQGRHGILVANTTVNLTLKNVRTLQNSKSGVTFNGGAQTVVLDNIMIDQNSDSGLACSGPMNSITIIGNSELINNTSLAFGGGMLVNNGCQVNVSSTSITGNSAERQGGGVYVSSGAQVNLHGVNIQSNVALGDIIGGGAGVYATDEGTSVTLTQSQLSNNTTSLSLNEAGSGGAFYATKGAEISGHGLRLEGNGAGLNNAFRIRNNASLLLTQSRILNHNLVQGALGSVDSGGTVTIENSIISDNVNTDGADYIVAAKGSDTTLNMSYVTLTDNNVSTSSIYGEDASINISSSIIYEDQLVFADGGMVSFNITCALVNETDSFTADGTVQVGNPLFVDANNGDYHLQASSPAIDFCTSAANVNVTYPGDIDGQSRGYDQDGVDNGGVYDLGADEYQAGAYDLIFEDDFEGDN